MSNAVQALVIDPTNPDNSGLRTITAEPGPPCRISTDRTVSSSRKMLVVSKNDRVGMPYNGEPLSNVVK